jgi:hypothetical protein
VRDCIVRYKKIGLMDLPRLMDSLRLPTSRLDNPLRGIAHNSTAPTASSFRKI